MRTQTRPRIAYLSGPWADAKKAYEEWSRREKSPSFDIGYITQFYQVCSELGAGCYVITPRSEEYKFSQIGDCVFENRRAPDGSGIRYHIVTGIWFIRVLIALIRYRPDALIVTGLQNGWYWLAPLKLLGVITVPALHCAIWPRFMRLRSSSRFIMFLNRVLFYEHADAILAVAPEVSDQLRAFIHKKVDVSVFYPMFVRGYFDSIAPPSRIEGHPLRVMFTGRIETYKGVNIIVDLAERLEHERRGQFVFDLCGDGPELANLRELIRERNLGSVVHTHGHCNAEGLRAVLSQSHAVIVPTTERFEEGFPKVCAEAILAGRPVIASSVCCGLARIREAVIEVAPGDVDGYRQAVLQLHDDHSLYYAKCRACESLREQFYDFRNSYGAKLRAVMERYILQSQVQ